MSQALRFDGKVVIITGAGNGLGRQYALGFGALGAKVVVNDLGGGIHGGGKSSAAADQVVADIRAAGGAAIASYDSVEDGDKIVQAALDAFGTVHIVVNNAGILRDASLHKMTLDDWNLIYKVHLYGSFRVAHAAWPVLRAQGYGRMIFTTSAAGLYGNFGQANYSAAKMGIYGLASALAIEGRSRGIHVNTIAPIAGSRLTETILEPAMLLALKPEFVAPLVTWLCHENCSETGGLFEVGASYISKVRWERSRGHTFGVASAFDAGDIATQWHRIVDFANAEHPTSIDDTFGVIGRAVSKPARAPAGNAFIDPDQALAASVIVESSYDERDVALYALGVGAASDPLDRGELAFVYERERDFSPLPTFAVVPAGNAMIERLNGAEGLLTGLNFGFDRLLHGEQYTEIRAPWPRAAQLRHTLRLKAAYDKNPHAVIVLAITTTDSQGRELAYNEFTSFVRDAGGWGGERGPSGGAHVPPAREPDAVIEERTAANQALLYRLSGDWNPLHADPCAAKEFGYDTPILHGLCTYGYVGRHVIKAFCDGDAGRFSSISVRFADVVFPGETLVTRMWKQSETLIVFETRVKERDKLVIKNAAVGLRQSLG